MKPKLPAIALAVALMVGCAAQNKPSTLPTGAINQLDASTYLVLRGTQAVLGSVRVDFDKLPPSAKPAYNRAVASYNVAEAAWQTYHKSGGGDNTALLKAVNQASTDTTAVLTTIGAHK
jgi:hypothetical protein